MMGAAMAACKTSTQKWLIMYGSDLTAAQLKGVKLAIVEPESAWPSRFPGVATPLYAYVSVGAVDYHRAYWPTLKDSSAVVEPDPDWPESYRLDIRAPLWQHLLLERIIPKIASQKFAGVFLDTIDTPLYLEERDPSRFAGSRAALIHVISQIRQKFPGLGVIPNNGLPILAEIGSLVDGVVVEDLYTRYDFATKSYGATPETDTHEKEAALDAFKKQFKKPVYIVLYGEPNSPIVKQAIARCRKKGYHWYVTTVDLMRVGVME